MRLSRTFFAAAVATFVAATVLPLGPASAQRSSGDSIQLAGRTVQCKHVRVLTDRHIPSEGAAAPGVLILNPSMLSEQPPVVRLFVFNHECGHHNVGESELKADCWAVQHGVREGWLDAKGVAAVCQSFENAPATATHPSGRKRCQNLDQCFTTALAAQRAAKPVIVAAPGGSGTAVAAPAPPPRLVSGPTLISTGTLSYSDPTPCKEPATPTLVDGRPARSGGCR
jgi:hypothetical protein